MADTIESLRAALALSQQHVQALEDHLDRMHTCVVCGCALLPTYAPPHCEDSCRPDDDQAAKFEGTYLESPVSYFRAKFAPPWASDG